MLTLAAGIADTILSNVDAWYEGVITYEAFNERQIIAWGAAEESGVVRMVADIIGDRALGPLID
jgi:hypothetical protein